MKQRLYGLDILRIFSMLGIVGLHILNQGGFLAAANSHSEVLAAHLVAALFYCSVNVFAMLSGYLYIRRDTVRSASLLKLLLTSALYCVCAVAVAMVVKPKLFAYFPDLYKQALFPPLAGRYWYLTCYVLLFVMIPYLNAMVRSLSQRQMGSMLFLLLVLLSCMTTFGQADYFRINKGYSPFWLMFCYLIGGYIRLYHEPLFGKKRAFALLLVAANMAVIAAVWKIWGEDAVKKKVLLLEYISPLMVVNAAVLVQIFAGMHVSGKWTQKLILHLSDSAFGVYLIHSHILIYDFWLKNAFATAGKGGLGQYLGILLAGLLGIYLVCTFLDRVRKLLFRVICLDRAIDWAGEKIDRCLGWYEESAD